MSTLDCEEIETLLYQRLEGRDRGWRVELLLEQLTSKVEQKLLLCGYCSGLMRDACVMEKEGKQELRCHVCIPEGTTCHEAQMNREAINGKLIVCPLGERGCAWRDTVSRGIQHLKECEFLPVLCPLKCVESGGERSGEVARVERRQMGEHEREYCPQRQLRCEYCGCGVTACEMNPHLGECSAFPVECPNGCEVAGETGVGQVKRGDVPLHLAECPLQTVKCPYWDYGCREEMERRQLDLHERESMHIHFNLAMKEMREMKSQLIEANNKIASKDLEICSIKKDLKEVIEFFSPHGRLEWKIEGIKQKIGQKADTYSDPFYVGLYKCQGNIEWDCSNSGKVGCYICIMKGEFDSKLKWPFIYSYKFILLSQDRDQDDCIYSSKITRDSLQKYPECFQRPASPEDGGYGTPSFISHVDLLTEKYCSDDSISFHIIMEQLYSC